MAKFTVAQELLRRLAITGLDKADIQKRYGHVPVTAERIKHLAAIGLAHPDLIDTAEIQELCGSVMAHIQRHG